MYKVPPHFETLKRNLRRTLKENATVLLHVELTLFLAESLGFETEPLSIGWVLLSRMPLNHHLLKRLSKEQRRMLANAALIIPLSSRYAWENALLRYAQIPPEYRFYAVSSELPFSEQMIELARQVPCPDPKRLDDYTLILGASLGFKRRKIEFAEAGKNYRLRFKMNDSPPKDASVTISDEMAKSVKKDTVWFKERHQAQVLELMIQDLRSIAEWLDEREKELGGNPHWLADWEQIRY